MEEDLTWGSEHTIQYTDNVSQNYTLETYIISLSNVNPINLIKIFFKVPVWVSRKLA